MSDSNRPIETVPQPDDARDSASTRRAVTVLLVTILAGVTRLWSRSATIWHPGEASLALRLASDDTNGNLVLMLAALIGPAVDGWFDALQAVATVAAIVLFPVAWALGRRLGLGLAPAISFALLIITHPRIWYLGGTAFATIPALALLLASLALLLDARRPWRKLIAGTIVLAATCGVDPFLALPGVILLFVLAAEHAAARRVGIALASAIASLAIAALAYRNVGGVGALASMSGAPTDTALDAIERAGVALRTIWDSETISITLVLLAAAGLAIAIRRPRNAPAAWWLSALMVPPAMLIVTILPGPMAERSLVLLVPLLALLVLTALESLFSALAPSRPGLAPLVAILLSAITTAWSLPAINLARTTASPPVTAARWLAANLPPGDPVYVTGTLLPIASLLLPDNPARPIEGGSAPVHVGMAPSYAWTERSDVPGATLFRRRMNRLRDLAGDAPFQVALAPLPNRVTFGPGWYEAERWGNETWRWMAERSSLALPPESGLATVELDLYVPLQGVERSPQVTIAANGNELQRFEVTRSSFLQKIVFPSNSQSDNVLAITVEPTAFDERTGREIGLMLRNIRLESQRFPPDLGEGWYGLEGSGTTTWRWMAGRADATLPALPGGRGIIRVRGWAPVDQISDVPVVTLTADGEEVGQVAAPDGGFEIAREIDAGRPVALTISTSSAFRPAERGVSGDGRELGLQIFELQWTPVPRN